MSLGFNPVGKCIYCGATDEPLTKEHIIPYGLEGDKTLPKASCAACAKITRDLEGYCQGKMLGLFRQSTGFRTRHKNNRPAKLPLDVTFADGSTGTLMLSPAKYPKTLCLPLFPAARALRGLQPERDGVALRGSGWWHWWDDADLKRLATDHEIVKFEGSHIDPLQFARMIAKIAHGAAVANWGIETFRSLSADFIRGTASGMNYLVGCMGDETIETTDLHTIGFREGRANGMLIVMVRLFACFGAPTYHVLVGLRPGGRITKVFSQAAEQPLIYPLAEASQQGPITVRDVTQQTGPSNG